MCLSVCVWVRYMCATKHIWKSETIWGSGSLMWAQDQFEVIRLGSVILPAFGYFLRELSCNIAGLELVGSIYPPASASWVAELQMHLWHPALVIFLPQFKFISAWIS